MFVKFLVKWGPQKKNAYFDFISKEGGGEWGGVKTFEIWINFISIFLKYRCNQSKNIDDNQGKFLKKDKVCYS